MVYIYVTTYMLFNEHPEMDPPRKCGLTSLLPVLGQYSGLTLADLRLSWTDLA